MTREQDLRDCGCFGHPACVLHGGDDCSGDDSEGDNDDYGRYLRRAASLLDDAHHAIDAAATALALAGITPADYLRTWLKVQIDEIDELHGVTLVGS